MEKEKISISFPNTKLMSKLKFCTWEFFSECIKGFFCVIWILSHENMPLQVWFHLLCVILKIIDIIFSFSFKYSKAKSANII